MDFESRVRNFLMYASDSWVSLLAVEFLLLSGIACELFVIFRARSYPPGVLVVASLCGVILPVTPLALASRQALTSERAALAALPGSGLDAGMAVVELSHHLTLGAPLLVALLILAGIGLSRILIGIGARTPEAYAPVAGGSALALLVGGFGFNLAGLNAVVFPGHTICGPQTYADLVRESVAEAAALSQVVMIGFVVALALSFVWGFFLCLSWSASRPSLSSAVIATALLSGSVLLILESAPLMSELGRGRLPINNEFTVLHNDWPHTPQLTGPDGLDPGLTVFAKSSGFEVINRPTGLGSIASALESARQQFAELHNAAYDLSAEFKVTLVAQPELTGRRLIPAFEQVSHRSRSIELGFRLVTTIQRPLLGPLGVPHESGLLLGLISTDGSTPITFGADETYDAFARRAVELRRQGPVHLVLPTE